MSRILASIFYHGASQARAVACWHLGAESRNVAARAAATRRRVADACGGGMGVDSLFGFDAATTRKAYPFATAFEDEPFLMKV
jgi:hypothetical protein